MSENSIKINSSLRSFVIGMFLAVNNILQISCICLQKVSLKSGVNDGKTKCYLRKDILIKGEMFLLHEYSLIFFDFVFSFDGTYLRV